MIDIATTLCEIVRLENKTSEHVAMKFQNEWLTRYPRPLKVIHDPGTEFTGAYFQQMLQLNAIEATCTTVANPQANAISERLHSTIGDQLRTMLHENPPVNVANGLELIDTVIASARYAMRSAVHRTLKVSPNQETLVLLLFKKYMSMEQLLSYDVRMSCNESTSVAFTLTTVATREEAECSMHASTCM